MGLLDWIRRYATPAREKCTWCGGEYDIYELAERIPAYGWVHQGCYFPAFKSALAQLPRVRKKQQEHIGTPTPPISP